MFASLTQKFHFARAIKSRSFTFVWLGQLISTLGDGIFFTALSWQVLVMTGSATAMGVVLMASVVPKLVLVLVGGALADRLPRKHIVLWSDAGRGILLLLLAIFSWMHLLQLWQFFIQALLFGIIDGFFDPAILSLTPELVKTEDLPSANSLVSFNQIMNQLLGPALGAILVALFSATGAFFVDALSFFASVGFLLCVRLPPRLREPQASLEVATDVDKAENEPAKRQGLRGIAMDIGEGLVYVKQSPWILITIVAASVSNLGFIGALAVAMPKLVHDVYGQGVWMLGLINSSTAVGSILGLALVSQASHLKRRGLLVYLSMLVSAVGIITFGLPFPPSLAPVIAPIAAGLAGIGFSCFNTLWFTILQEKVPEEKLGRVFSIDTLGSFAMIPLADAFGGLAADRFGPAFVCVLTGLLTFVINGFALFRREIRQLE
ncbi:MAG TPA: MFS transporter [Ktedonobacteraceae bacterium]|nr:MFS transporter [Ktedonobacteraceae bacterium]